MKFDEFLFTYLGEMGRYQKMQFLLVCFPTIIVSMHAVSWSLASVPVPFRQCYYNEDCKLDGAECETHVYDRSRVKYSAVERWEITCSRGNIRATVQACYYIGQMIGSMVFGMLGDRIGRKKVFIIAIFLQITCGFAVVGVPTWWLFALFRAGLGFSHPGIFVIAVVIGTELVGPKYRKLAAVITGGFFSVGQFLLAVEGYFITDYRYLQLAIVSPAVIFLSYYW
ncbi:unnamed protein product [Haemonchus placei]|uniref:MFS domain-containing protein n=1 Tax=Haemonchus placei TaxID=6290 RepID=A0A0N4WH99_HAEPC|nr:unnamed protein product [Haemonchus placei]